MILVLPDWHPQRERAHPLSVVVRLLEELCCEVRMAERATRVHGVAEGDRAAIVPAITHALDGSGWQSLKCPGQRLALKRVAGNVVAATQKGRKDSD